MEYEELDMWYENKVNEITEKYMNDLNNKVPNAEEMFKDELKKVLEEYKIRNEKLVRQKRRMYDFKHKLFKIREKYLHYKNRIK